MNFTNGPLHRRRFEVARHQVSTMNTLVRKAKLGFLQGTLPLFERKLALAGHAPPLQVLRVHTVAQEVVFIFPVKLMVARCRSIATLLGWSECMACEVAAAGAVLGVGEPKSLPEVVVNSDWLFRPP